MSDKIIIENPCLDPSRRKFLKRSALATSFVLGFFLPLSEKARAYMDEEEEKKTARYPIAAWLQVTPTGQVSFVIPVSEMGQGSQASLAMILADEMGADYDTLMVLNPDNNTLFTNPMFGMQLTGASTSVRAWWKPLRVVGATVRSMFISAAAKQWQVPVEECIAKKGQVQHVKSGRTLPFSALVETARTMSPPSNPVLKNAKDYDYIGRSMPRVDSLTKITGEAVFGMDVVVPNMLIAAVAQSPVFQGKLSSMNKEAALAVSGVKAVKKIDHGVAVIATTYWQALTGLRQLKPQFTGGKTTGLTSAKIEAALTAGLKETSESVIDKGNMAQTGSPVISQHYQVPYLAHTTMEPMNATAHVTDDLCEIWAPTQAQSIAVKQAAQLTLLEPEQIKLHTTYLGGGFGRRAQVDYIEQAVQLSMEMKAPVKVIWSREEDVQHDFYRPSASASFEVSLAKDGLPLTWKSTLVSDSIMAYFMPSFLGGIDGKMYEGMNDFDYQIPNQQLKVVRKDLGIPLGFWRSVGYSFTTFFVESMIDELAHTAKIDPLTYRQRLLKKDSRSLRVLNQLAEKTNWSVPSKKGQGKGIAITNSFGSYVAQIVEVAINAEGKPIIKQVHCAIDCGQVINPSIVKRQIQSAVIYGLSAALKGKITFENGHVVESNFHDYPALKMAETPPITVHIVASNNAPGGYGEVGLPPIAPALANAIFAATGKRHRVLPLV